MIGAMEGIGLGMSVYNAVQAAAAARAARRRRAELLRQASVLHDKAVGDLQTQRGTKLMGMTGQLGDAIRSLGRSSADALGQAGITNSGVVGRGILEAQDRGNSALLSADQQLTDQILSANNGYQQWLLGQQLGVEGENLAQAQATAGGAYGSVGSILGEIAKRDAAAAAKKAADAAAAKTGTPAAAPGKSLTGPGLNLGTLPSLDVTHGAPLGAPIDPPTRLTAPGLQLPLMSLGTPSGLGQYTQDQWWKLGRAGQARNLAPWRNGSQGMADPNRKVRLGGEWRFGGGWQS